MLNPGRITSIFQILLLKLDLGIEASFLQPVSVGLGVGTAEDILPALLYPLNQRVLNMIQTLCAKGENAFPLFLKSRSRGKLKHKS